MQKFEELHTENIDALFEPETRLLRIQYHGTITAKVNHDLYAWIGRLVVQANGNINLALGSIYDFRDVTEFDSNIISAAQKNSQQINRDMSLRYHPVALIVKTLYQREYVHLTMRISPQEDRKRIVETDEQAEAFIQKFCEKYREFLPR
jgi:GH15 family glucan-1,4-alpha-glucosidase